MLGYVVADTRGVLDAVILRVALQLEAEGLRLAGAVQAPPDRAPPDGGAGRCDMKVRLLGTDRVICISQRLGPHARGCRLDVCALEDAAAEAERVLAGSCPSGRPHLLIVNKFGKAELEGRGFRPVIANALGAGIPVLTAVGRGGLPGFEGFADGFATALPFAAEPMLEWCRDAVALAAAQP